MVWSWCFWWGKGPDVDDHQGGQSVSTADAAHHDADREHLHELGYAQELKRGLGTFSNFAISFSIISILAGGWTSYWLGITYGGPLVVTVGWIIVGFFSLMVGMAMGEICSAYPTAGGLYYWSAKLARKNGAMWSWFTGWFNFLGQIGVIASVDFALANYVAYVIGMYDSGFRGTKWTLLVIYFIVLGLHGLLNTFSVNIVKKMGDVSVWWHVGGVAVILAVLLVAPSAHRPVSYIFDYQNNSPWQGGISTVYAFFLGFLLAQYTITGFDASAHVSEETVGARVNAPKAITRSIWISAIAALIMNFAFLIATPKDPETIKKILAGGIVAPAILIQTVLSSFWAKVLIIISTMGQFFCGLASVTANSRMIYAFSRDGGLPFSNIWHKINPRTRTPTNSLWLGVVVSAVTGLITLIQKDNYPVAFFALTGICVVGLYIAYVIPIFLRLRNPEFQQGPWNLGKWSQIVGWTAVVWVGFITILFFAPLSNLWRWWNGDEVNSANFTAPLIVLSFIGIGLWWVASARNWFKGPKVQGSREELMAIERELDALELGATL